MCMQHLLSIIQADVSVIHKHGYKKTEQYFTTGALNSNCTFHAIGLLAIYQKAWKNTRLKPHAAVIGRKP